MKSVADELRAAVNAWVAQSGRGGMAKLAKTLKVNQSSIYKWLQGGNIGWEYVDDIATVTGLRIRFEVAEGRSTSDDKSSTPPMTHYVPTSESYHPSTVQVGGVHDPARVLKGQLDELQDDFDKFAEQVGGAVKHFGRLVADKAKKDAARKSSGRQADRVDAGNVLKRSKKRGKP